MNNAFENRSGKSIVIKIIVAVALVGLCIAAIAVAFRVIAPNVASHGTVSLRNSIIQSANQCYAIEGSYPYNLQYLEDNYGLSVNHDDYSVTYEVFADNVAPNVVVVEK